MDIDRVIVYNGVTRYELATVRRLFCFGSIKIEAFRFYAVNSQYSWYKILQSVTAIVSMPTFDKKTRSLWVGIAHRSSSMRICLDDDSNLGLFEILGVVTSATGWYKRFQICQQVINNHFEKHFPQVRWKQV